MSEVTIRDLRNQGGAVVDRVAKGELLTITRSGKPIAELRPLRGEPKSLDVILAAQRRLPMVDPGQLRSDLDELLDPGL